MADRALLAQVLREHELGIVPESVREPLKYYGNNTCATRKLLAACLQQGVRQLVFSSTAAVYGIPAGGMAGEDAPPAPIPSIGVRHGLPDSRRHRHWSQ